MMWKEFEEIAGYEVSFEDYNNVIEPMYLATSLSKTEFVKCLDKKRFALPTKRQVINQMKKKAEEIREIVEHTGAYQEKEELRKMAFQYAERFFGFKEDSINWYCYFNTEHTLPDGRGCSFPVEIVIGYKYAEYERLQLIRG